MFIELTVIFFDACGGQQLRHDFFVFVRALAQVHRGQMEAKHFHRPDQRVQALRSHSFGVVAAQRGFDHAQIGQKVFSAGVGVLRGHCVTCGIPSREFLQGRGQSCINACEGAAVGLVLTVFAGIG